jgi:hypothetical protein
MGDAAEPFLAPFHPLNLEPIFDLACRGEEDVRSRFAATDPAIRWLLAPGYHDEDRLTAAITAIENLIDREFPKKAALFVDPKAFSKFASAVREFIDAMALPKEMKEKIAELNRRPLLDKLGTYLKRRNIPVDDLPDLQSMIKARNAVVHTGVYPEVLGQTSPDQWETLLFAREILTRVLLSELGFVGNYFSPFYGPNCQLRFPSCRPLTG